MPETELEESVCDPEALCVLLEKQLAAVRSTVDSLARAIESTPIEGDRRSRVRVRRLVEGCLDSIRSLAESRSRIDLPESDSADGEPSSPERISPPGDGIEENSGATDLPVAKSEEDRVPGVRLAAIPLSGDGLREILKENGIRRLGSVRIELLSDSKSAILSDSDGEDARSRIRSLERDAPEANSVRTEDDAESNSAANKSSGDSVAIRKRKGRKEKSREKSLRSRSPETSIGRPSIAGERSDGEDTRRKLRKELLSPDSGSDKSSDSLCRFDERRKRIRRDRNSDENEPMGRSQRMKSRAGKCIPVVELNDSSSDGIGASIEKNDIDSMDGIEDSTDVATSALPSSKLDAMNSIKTDLLNDDTSASENESKINGENGVEEIKTGESDETGKKKPFITVKGPDSDLFDNNITLGGTDSDDSEVFQPKRRKRKPKKDASDVSSDISDEDSESKGKSKKRKRIKKASGEDSDQNDSDAEDHKKHGRKNIRRVKKSSNLDEATKDAAKKERQRLQRIAERQKLYNECLFDESGKPDAPLTFDKVVLDFDPETKEPMIQVDKGLVEKLKPHQANGIKFMWNACFESVKQIRDTKGSGCILAHCMGLGKTLQVVTLVHTLLTHQKLTKVERVLVVCPLSTVLNWVNEFRMWLKFAKCKDQVNIYELSKFKQNYERCYQLKDWLESGGVCVLGYEMFRNLSADNNKKFKKAQLTAFQKALVDPGPDLVVCDEGHLLKNEKTSLSQSMNRVKTLRRIVLTGTPLQNNLKEYYCMVQFVKPNLLGKYNEYLNRFVNPITNGQYTDSTDHDIRVMKRRSHVLHKMLDGAVQRRDYSVLAPFLPPKHEYVLFISLTEIQIKLYRHYLENFSRRPQPDRKSTGFLFPDFQSLQRIWTHPLVLKANSERYELMQQKKRDKENSDEESEGSLADFIDDDDEEEEESTPPGTSESESEISLSSDEDDNPKKKKKGKSAKVSHKRVTRANADANKDEIIEIKPEERQENPTEWWISLCSDDELDDIRHSNKILLLLDILKMCEAIGDKVLVFSQSLYSLDLIEQFLSKIDDATQRSEECDHLAGHSGSWSVGLDYFRLDGSTSCENRALWCKSFNREDNPRARLFLISTRAGGLGINLVAANRVVIFDMSWNPSHDVQSIFRVYRFGQKKPCYIYRFLALGTMEEKIYERQVTKQAISKRVIDEQQIDRHYAESDLAELYTFNPVPSGQREVPKLPKDRLFADLLKQHDSTIYKYHEHDSLLENKEEETLTEEERKAAWEDYENEKNRPPPTVGFGNNFMFGLQQQQQQEIAIRALSSVLRQDYPNLTEQQLAAMAPVLLQRMYQNGDPALMQKMNSMMATPFKYPTANPMMQQPMMMNSAGNMPTGSMSGMQSYGSTPTWQQQQQLQFQQIQQRQNMNMKYYAGGLGSRDAVDMAALQQQQRAMLLGQSVRNPRGRPPKISAAPSTTEIVDLDSE